LEVNGFRELIEKHIREEEDNLFPRLAEKLGEDEAFELTDAMKREGFKAA
jgi:hemerythrin-like domain-containing protein